MVSGSQDIQALALPLGDLQRELQRGEHHVLLGDAVAALRTLPAGTGGVIRLPRDAASDVAPLRSALREAAAQLRIENSERGLLVMASREEGTIVSLYFWYTADAAAIEEAEPEPVAPVELATQVEPNGNGAKLAHVEPPPPVVAHPPSEALEQEHTLSDAAAELGVSVKTVRRAIKSGRVPARLVDGPRGPEYRVDIRALNTGGPRIGKDRVRTPHRTPVLASAPASSIAPEEINQLAERLASLEAEVNQLRGA